MTSDINPPANTESKYLVKIRYLWLTVIFAINGIFALYAIIDKNPRTDVKLSVWVLNLIFGLAFIYINLRNDLNRASEEKVNQAGYLQYLGIIENCDYSGSPSLD